MSKNESVPSRRQRYLKNKFFNRAPDCTYKHDIPWERARVIERIAYLFLGMTLGSIITFAICDYNGVITKHDESGSPG